MARFNPSPYSTQNPEDYGFLFIVPALVGGMLAKKSAATAKSFLGFEEEEEEPGVLSIMKEYWWVGLLGLPLGFVGLNLALNAMKSPEEKAALAAKKAADKKMMEDWG
jgi:hypothetical protein